MPFGRAPPRQLVHSARFKGASDPAVSARALAVACRPASRLARLWIVPLLSVAAAAQGDDLRLIEAVKRGDVSLAAKLLASAAVDVDAAEPDGATALHWAAHRNDMETARLLLRAGASVDPINDYGVTPLIVACRAGNTALVEPLLAAGASPDTALPHGETAVMACARTGDAIAVSALLSHGADPNAAETTKGQTALMWAVSERAIDVARELIRHGADVRARSASGFTPLLFAARAGNVGAVRLLLSNGADVRYTAPDGSTPLLAAAILGHVELVDLLLEAGADVNADAAGYTPLHWASGTWESAMTPQYARTPLAGSWFGLPSPEKTEFVRLLLERGADPNARLTKQPPRYGSSLFAVNYLVGATSFYLAAAAGNTEVMHLLLEYGADPILTAEDGTTPLTVAAGLTFLASESVQSEQRHLEAVALCVDLGLDVNAANDTGDTALHGAAFAGFDTVVQFLVDAGADMGAKNANLQTPLGVAEGGRCCTSNTMMV